MSELKKELSFPAILLITINSVLGTGIFFLPAIGAGHAGPASIISWGIMGLIAIYIGMCFAELSSMFPKAGGIYEFCKQAFGRFPSFMIGWATIIAGNVTIAMLVVGAIQYIFPANIPWITVPLSLFFVVVFNYIAYRGLKTSAFMLITFAFITLGTLAVLVIPGFLKFNSANLVPFFPLGTSAVFVTIFFIAETFFGWETATFLAEETKDGQRVMPKALIIATVVIAVIAMIVVISSLAVVSWQEWSVSLAPLKDLSFIHYGVLGQKILTLLVYLAIIGSVAGWIVSAPRLLLAMARDELFLKQLAVVHPKYNTPYKAIFFQTILTSILVFVGVGSYNTLLHLLLPIVLLLYSFVLISMVVMRFTKKNVKRYYRAPLGTTLPLVIVVFLISLIVAWFREQANALQMTSIGLSFILLGVPVYFLLEMYYDPKFIRKTQDFFAYFNLFFENVSLPSWRRKEVLRLLGDVHKKTVYEYGCDVGTLTVELAEAVSPRGKVYATDLSKQVIGIAQRRVLKEGHKHVQILHDPKHTERAHPKIPKADALVSVGRLGYVKNIEAVLKHFAKKVKRGGRVVFLDYDKFFDVIPNIEWMSDDKHVIKYFADAGFKVKIERKQGFAWKWIYIYGKKL